MGFHDEKFTTWKEKQDGLFDLLEFAGQMMTVEARRDSFNAANWAYPSESPCNINALANAGWFYYPKSTCPNEAYCFVTLKCLGWEEDDDPWDEQEKRKKGHPLWRKFIPKDNDLEIIRKPQSEYTVLDQTLLSAAALEGHVKYKVDELFDMVALHQEALMSRENKKLAESPNFDETISSFETKVNNWANKINMDIANEAQRLSQIKRYHTARFRSGVDPFDVKFMKSQSQANFIDPYKSSNLMEVLNMLDGASAAKENYQISNQKSRQSVMVKKDRKAPPSASKQSLSMF